MLLCLVGHGFKYELEKIIRIFLPFEKIVFSESDDGSPERAVTVRERREFDTKIFAELHLSDERFYDERTIENDHPEYEKESERLLAVCLYNCFSKASGYSSDWGILTGVRPAKLFSALTKSGGTEYAENWFKNSLLVKENKISLCKETVNGEKRITDLSKKDSFSLYISVPFCPTRCSYCSFVSHSIERAKNLIPEYIELLKKEIIYTAEIAKQLSLRLESVYIGGGTPTSLEADGLETIMTAVNENFDTSFLREFTVEAGRPDTVTEEKLLRIKKCGATRISINPQTMNDEVLAEIGRKHTAHQTEAAFNLARKCGFDNINTDLIAGLPKDNIESFKNTLEKVLSFNPESVTVHSLSMKRASNMTVGGNFPDAKVGTETAKMVEFARAELSSHGIFPYYMYRQSKTVGNLENVGYAKPGFECLYNVFTMDETHSILACGASAVTKLREPGGKYIERILNFKYPYEYIGRHNEIMERKKGIIEFYEKFPAGD